MRAGPRTKRTALVLAMEQAKESATKWSQVANSLRREGYREMADDAELIHQACAVQAMKHSVALLKVENHLRRLSEKALRTIGVRGQNSRAQKAGSA